MTRGLPKTASYRKIVLGLYRGRSWRYIEALNGDRQARDFAPPSQRAALETLIAELEAAQTR
jgi:hypothetical protein